MTRQNRFPHPEAMVFVLILALSACTLGSVGAPDGIAPAGRGVPTAGATTRPNGVAGPGAASVGSAVPFVPVAPDDLPPKIRAWVELFQGATLSGARSFGPHTYLVAARTGHRVRIQKGVRRTYEVPHQLDVVVDLSPSGEEVAVVRIPTFQGEVYFWAAGELLPQVRNVHGLP